MRSATLLVALMATLVTAAPAASAPDRRIAGYCSPSGDVCYGIFDVTGVVKFQLTTAARYFSRYRICVRPPRGATTCRSFPVRAVGRNFGGTVVWQRNFPNRGAGSYRVRWRLGAQALGPALVFRRST
jgi:hypothetical protein